MGRHILTVDLGYGDCGKGTIVDALVRRHNTTLVVRYSGGAQCAHNVVTDKGVHHCFSQFGSGALVGAHTLLDHRVVVDPIRLINEGIVLQDKGLVHDRPLTRVSVHENCLVITPFHRALNCLTEAARSNRHGSCGVGVGETVAYSLRHPVTALRIKHLDATDILRWLTGIRDDLLPLARRAYTGARRSPSRAVEKMAEEEWATFTNPHLIEALCWRYSQFCKLVKRVSEDEACSMVQSHSTVFEGAQGVLLDEDYGFHPHTTWSQVTLRHAIDRMARASVGEDGYETLGIIRSYACRHGAGPLPTEFPLSVMPDLKEPHNLRNPWQGSFRVGRFDAVMTKYAISVAGRIDGLAITHLDKVAGRWNMAWPICTVYDRALQGGIPRIDPANLPLRQKLTHQIGRLDMDEFGWMAPTDHSAEGTADIIAKHLGVPLKITSYGPTAGDKKGVGKL